MVDEQSKTRQSKTLSWASRELESMPMIIRTALKIEKMMEFMVEAGFHPRDLHFLTPEQEDRTQHDRRLRMWGVIQNFLRRVMKGAFNGNGELFVLPR